MEPCWHAVFLFTQSWHKDMLILKLTCDLLQKIRSDSLICISLCTNLVLQNCKKCSINLQKAIVWAWPFVSCIGHSHATFPSNSHKTYLMVTIVPGHTYHVTRLHGHAFLMCLEDRKFAHSTTNHKMGKSELPAEVQRSRSISRRRVNTRHPNTTLSQLGSMNMFPPFLSILFLSTLLPLATENHFISKKPSLHCNSFFNPLRSDSESPTSAAFLPIWQRSSGRLTAPSWKN